MISAVEMIRYEGTRQRIDVRNAATVIAGTNLVGGYLRLHGSAAGAG